MSRAFDLALTGIKLCVYVRVILVQGTQREETSIVSSWRCIASREEGGGDGGGGGSAGHRDVHRDVSGLVYLRVMRLRQSSKGKDGRREERIQ